MEDNCIYQMHLPINGDIICGYYSKNVFTKNKYHIAHYPYCCDKNCPIINKNLIRDAQNKKWNGESWE